MWDGSAETRTTYYMKSEPPTMARAYDSKAYPLYHDARQGHIQDAGLTGRPPIDQLTDQNRILQEHERGAFHSLKVDWWEDLREEHTVTHPKPNYCDICSESTYLDTGEIKIILHRHDANIFSRLYKELDAIGRFTCEPCGPSTEVHSYKFAARVPIVLTSSTLHRPFLPGFIGQEIHVDWSTIPGGKVDSMAQAFKALYSRSCRPVDVLIVCGINDLGSGMTAEEVYKKLMRLKAKVLEVCPRHPTGRSTFAIATLPHPPMWTTYGSDIHEPSHDRTKEFMRLTEKTVAHNKSSPQEPFPIKRAPQFHKYGVKLRFAKKGESILRKVPCRHRMSQWREEDDSRKLHLSNDKREKMAVDCVNYFKTIYKICLCKDHVCLCP